MTTADIAPAASSPQLTRFLQFVAWAFPITLGFSVLYGLIGLFGNNFLAGITSLIGFGFGLLLLSARQQARKNQLTLAAIMIAGGQLAAALIIVLVVPTLYPALVCVPLLAVALALPYTQGRAMLQLIIAAGVIATLVAVLGNYVDIIAVAPVQYMHTVLVGMLVLTIALILLLLWQFSHRLNETLAHAHNANQDLAAVNSALESANQQMNVQLDQQRQLLELIMTLETPAVSLADHVLLAPIVGHIDSRRAQSLTQRLLQTVDEHKARLVIIDIAGVPIVDTAVAQSLIQMAQAIQLLGCQVRMSGITATVAATLVNLGISLHTITTVRSPQDALAEYHKE